MPSLYLKEIGMKLHHKKNPLIIALISITAGIYFFSSTDIFNTENKNNETIHSQLIAHTQQTLESVSENKTDVKKQLNPNEFIIQEQTVQISHAQKNEETNTLIAKEVSKILSSRDFEEYVVSLEKNESESYEIQQQYQDAIFDFISNNDFALALTSFKCDDQKCASRIDYDDIEEVEALIRSSFINGSRSISLMTQPVIINGMQEMRVVFSFAESKLII